MKTLVLLLAALVSVAAAEDRGELEFTVGGGVWMPALFQSGTQLSPGPAAMVSLQIPPSLGNCFIISAGYLSAGSDNEDWDGISGIPLTVGYRSYPFYRTYAGPRGIEPFLGIYGGGVLLWDSPAGDLEKTSTGAAVIGAELGTRVLLGETISLDLTVSPERVPAGSALAGEDSEDLSGLKITASLVF